MEKTKGGSQENQETTIVRFFFSFEDLKRERDRVVVVVVDLSS